MDLWLAHNCFTCISICEQNHGEVHEVQRGKAFSVSHAWAVQNKNKKTNKTKPKILTREITNCSAPQGAASVEGLLRGLRCWRLSPCVVTSAGTSGNNPLQTSLLQRSGRHSAVHPSELEDTSRGPTALCFLDPLSRLFLLNTLQLVLTWSCCFNVSKRNKECEFKVRKNALGK